MIRFFRKDDGVIRTYDLRRPGMRAIYIAVYAVMLIVVAACVLPIIWVTLSGFKDQKEFLRGVKSAADNKYYVQFLPLSFALDGYAESWNVMKFYKYYLNSFWSVLGSTVCALLFNGLMAYVISRLRPRGHKIVFALVMGSLMLPATTSMVPLFLNISRVGLQGSFVPLWLAFGANAFYVILFKNFYDTMPESLLEAARLDGASDLALFFRIVLPLSMPINMVVIIYAINAAWSDFLLPYLVLNNSPLETVMVRLFSYRTSDRIKDIDIIRAIVFSITPPILLFIIFQRQITQNVVSAGIKG
ncbi:MAG: carbohydrate ABC transporter permease [Oscillospiraceae bacterium]|jgi:multiple sugar transport system permease protein|nr:carbohydrate ABC transporter permease [Oscillospiraceae bacterium]